MWIRGCARFGGGWCWAWSRIALRCWAELSKLAVRDCLRWSGVSGCSVVGGVGGGGGSAHDADVSSAT